MASLSHKFNIQAFKYLYLFGNLIDADDGKCNIVSQKCLYKTSKYFKQLRQHQANIVLFYIALLWNDTKDGLFEVIAM